MTKEAYLKAEKIQDEIHRWENLYSITLKPYHKYGLVKKFLWIVNYEDTEAVMCDSGLTELIREYCDKKIRELKKELEAL